MFDISQIIELAKELEAEDPIDWSGLPLQRDVVYALLANSVLARIAEVESSQEREIILMSTAVKLVVENFVLEMRQMMDK